MAPDIVNLILISVSCAVCCLLIVLMVVVLYKKSPLCCRFRASTNENNTVEAPRYNSRHTLSGDALGGAAVDQFPTGAQPPRRPLAIGKPSDYHMDGPLPRLPSYESVRRKDRQQHIRQIIAQRFGLVSSQDEVTSRPPPTYDEALQQSPHLTESDLPTNSRDESSHRHEDAHNQSSTQRCLS